jgi:hypothetical protein
MNKAAEDLIRKRKLLCMLLKGTKFTKHSGGKRYERIFWVSLMFDQVWMMLLLYFLLLNDCIYHLSCSGHLILIPKLSPKILAWIPLSRCPVNEVQMVNGKLRRNRVSFNHQKCLNLLSINILNFYLWCPDHCITIILDDRQICLESSTEQERDIWVAGLTYILQMRSTNSGDKEAFYYWYSQQSGVMDCDSTLPSRAAGDALKVKYALSFSSLSAYT